MIFFLVLCEGERESERLIDLGVECEHQMCILFIAFVFNHSLISHVALYKGMVVFASQFAQSHSKNLACGSM